LICYGNDARQAVFCPDGDGCGRKSSK
jgi:hypothetical protein